MVIVDVALFGLVGALAVAMITLSWRVPRAISESNAQLNYKIDTAVAQINTKIDTSNAQLNTKIDTAVAQLHTKIDTTAAQLHTKIDDTNAMLADVRERVAYLEGGAGPYLRRIDPPS